MKKLSFLLGLSLITAPAWAAVDITAKSRSFIEALVDVAQYSRGSSGNLSPEAHEKIKKVSSQINFQSLAQASLKQRWGGFKAADRTEFLRVLQDLLETVAYPQAKKISAKLEEMNFKAQGKNQVLVSGTLSREKRGEIISQKFSLTLIFNAAGSQVVDAVIDGEKLSANLNRQFTEALKKKSFPEIIAQMKKRVDEAKTKNVPPV